MTTAVDTPYRSFMDQTLHYFVREHPQMPVGPISSPADWMGRDLKGSPHLWRHELSATDILELSEAADSLLDEGIPLAEVTRGRFQLPRLAPRIRGWSDDICKGKGFVVLRGLPVQDWGEEKSSYVFWGIGHHLGLPGAQNAAQELLGHVKNYGDEGADLVRQYRTTENILFHCDAADSVGLLCLQPAKEGGMSRIVSSVAVYNALLDENPDAAARLFEPFPLDRRNEHAPGEPGFIPIQPSCFGPDGVLRTFYHGEYFRSAQRHENAQIDELGLEAIRLYDELSDDPDRYLDMWLESGDMQFISNHTIVHARTGYEDWPEPERRRHLLRLWLSL
ncbi:MAG: TauD/TfdA family dioxygenase [Pseudomonadota bacterium]